MKLLSENCNWYFGQSIFDRQSFSSIDQNGLVMGLNETAVTPDHSSTQANYLITPFRRVHMCIYDGSD